MFFGVPGVMPPLAIHLLNTTQPLQLRPPNEVSYAQRRHEVESLRTVARYVRWLCIGQLGVHQVFKERIDWPPPVERRCRLDDQTLPYGNYSSQYRLVIKLLRPQKSPLSGGLLGGRDASVGTSGLQLGQGLLDVPGVLADGEERAAHVIAGLGIALAFDQ